MDALPTTRQELERKTVEYLETQAHLYATGRLDVSDLALIGKTAWNLTAGLIGDDVTNLAAITADMAKERLFKRHFVGNGKVVTLRWMVNKAGYALSTRDADAPASSVQHNAFKCEISERDERLEHISKTLEAQGFIEL